MENPNNLFQKGKPASPDFFTGQAFVNMLITDQEQRYNSQGYWGI
jgi:hypothetical protein